MVCSRTNNVWSSGGRQRQVGDRQEGGKPFRTLTKRGRPNVGKEETEVVVIGLPHNPSCVKVNPLCQSVLPSWGISSFQRKPQPCSTPLHAIPRVSSSFLHHRACKDSSEEFVPCKTAAIVYRAYWQYSEGTVYYCRRLRYCSTTPVSCLDLDRRNCAILTLRTCDSPGKLLLL